MKTELEIASEKALSFFSRYVDCDEATQGDMEYDRCAVLYNLTKTLDNYSLPAKAFDVVNNYERLVNSGKIEDKLYLDAYIDTLKEELSNG